MGPIKNMCLEEIMMVSEHGIQTFKVVIVVLLFVIVI